MYLYQVVSLGTQKFLSDCRVPVVKNGFVRFDFETQKNARQLKKSPFEKTLPPPSVVE